MPSSASTQPVLSVRHLRTYYDTDEGLVRAVDDISFDVPATGSVGIAGESGSGKTQTALSILGLIDGVPGIVGGEIRINEKNLLAGLDTFCSVREKEGFITITKDVSRWRAFYRKRRAHLRGEKIAMIFQEPKSALIPYYTVGEHMRET
ncbi:MAG: ATP-binding cassette domain-containing protein, partial [Rhodothermales bacterium]